MKEATATYEGLDVLKQELTLFLVNNSHISGIVLTRNNVSVTNKLMPFEAAKKWEEFTLHKYLLELIEQFFIKNPIVERLTGSNNDKIIFVVEPF